MTTVPDQSPKKNILYISYDGMTDQLGQSQVLPYLCGLQKEGYNFHLISCEKPLKLEQQRHIIEEVCKKNNITWHPVLYTKKPPVLSTLKDVIKVGQKAKKLNREFNFSLVHCRGYISSLVGLKLKRKYSVPFLFDMRGIWADEKVDAGTWNLKNPVYKTVYKYFKKKEKQFLESADMTISLTQAAKKEIHSWKHIAGNPVTIQVIPCCADMDLFNPSAVDLHIKSSIQLELGISADDTILSYLGSIGSWYMLDEMLDFFSVYLEKFPSAKFFFITGDQHELIRQRAAAKGIAPEKIIIRPAMRKEVPASISLSRHSVFFIRPTYSKISSSPTKQGELMGMGTPVVCNAGVGDTAMVVNEYRSGITINNFDQANYRQAVQGLLNQNFDPAEIRKGAADYFSLDKGVARYLEIYKQICK
jgi:glycosyltransferase involved in cell wall biosynthesis